MNVCHAAIRWHVSIHIDSDASYSGLGRVQQNGAFGRFAKMLAAKPEDTENRMHKSGILLLFFSFSWAVFAQQGAAAADGEPKGLTQHPTEMPMQAQQSERHITLHVLATDAAGKPVEGLQQQDFTILDNKQTQTIASFAAVKGATAEPPTEVILLIDLVNTSFDRVAFVRQSVEKFLQQNGGHLAYPTRLVFFSDTGTQLEPQPSRDGNALAAALEGSNSPLRIVRRSAGFYGAEERLQLSWQTLDQLINYGAQIPGRKMLIWISPGWPLLSGPNVEYTAKQQQNFFNSIVTFTNALRTSQTTLYALNPVGASENIMSTFYYETYLKGVHSSRQANSGSLALQVLAVQSGGRVLNASNDLTGLLNSSIEDASAYYVMSFDAPPADRVDEYHALTVKVDKPGVKTLTNAAYYSRP